MSHDDRRQRLVKLTRFFACLVVGVRASQLVGALPGLGFAALLLVCSRLRSRALAETARELAALIEEHRQPEARAGQPRPPLRRRSTLLTLLAGVPWLELSFVAMVLQLLLAHTQASLGAFVDGLPVARSLLAGLLQPKWQLLPSAIGTYARQTLEIACLGTTFGLALALPLSAGCARNLMGGNAVTRAIYHVARLTLVVVRALPTFLIGLIFVALVGLGPFPGVLAITVFSTGIMVKLFSEVIEAVDPGPVEAVGVAGGNWLNRIVLGVLPQVVPGILAQLLYCAEINVHSATVLGLIGAEGIGLPIHEYLSAFDYRAASTFILVTIVMTIVIDYTSANLRAYIS